MRVRVRPYVTPYTLLCLLVCVHQHAYELCVETPRYKTEKSTVLA